MATFRTYFILGRASNLPTVWSNCLAGWLLAGGGEPDLFVMLCLGATLVYTGGMYLNDAFDVDFDREHRRERPIPSGAISLEAVWRCGFLWLGLGVFTFSLLGYTTFLLALALTGCILFYDATHKTISWSPIPMAACRMLLYLVAACAGENGMDGFTLWCALALAAYIIGLSYLAKVESLSGPLNFWPVLFLFAPIVLGLLANSGVHLVAAGVIAALLAAWIIRCLYASFWAAERNVGQTVSGLLAGIVLVDLLAVAAGPSTSGLVFLILFLSALLFQRVVPAT